MLRSHTCGALNSEHIGQEVTLCGWVQKSRDLGGMTFVDLRDRYGITQIVFNLETNKALCEAARKLGREFVVSIRGNVAERESKNPNMPTGDIEIIAQELEVLNASKTPPFTIEKQTDGGEELRMQYRYLDLRRSIVRESLQLRNNIAIAVRNYMNQADFIEVETPYLIKSTPEGARDFIVPSRINEGEFYALPQSPQTFKQLLMVSGFDRYFQIVKCFRDEDLRADRQPEFTQIDCEMSFVQREDVLSTFEGLMKHLFKEVLNAELPDFEVMSYKDAINNYGSDKPDLRFGMPIHSIKAETAGKNFKVFDDAEDVLAIAVPGAAEYSRKQLDALTDFVKKPQIGAKGLVYVKCNEDGSYKSSVDKFYDSDALDSWAKKCEANKGDLILVVSGDRKKSLEIMGTLRLEMGQRLELLDNKVFKPLWVVDFPLLEFDEESGRYHAMHHPFTSPKTENLEAISENPGEAIANAYDMVINGVEVGGGSIRIHDKNIQSKVFDLLGFTKEEAEKQFGFLLSAFEYGAPPHGGIAFGFDRICALMGGQESIRDFIAFPKNNAGRDTMIDAPASVSNDQLQELGLKVEKRPEA